MFVPHWLCVQCSLFIASVYNYKGQAILQLYSVYVMYYKPGLMSHVICLNNIHKQSYLPHSMYKYFSQLSQCVCVCVRVRERERERERERVSTSELSHHIVLDCKHSHTRCLLCEHESLVLENYHLPSICSLQSIAL